MTKFWMCLCKVTKPSWPSLLSLKVIPFTLVIWLSRVCKFQIFTSWVLKYLSFRVVYFQFMALLFLHLHLSSWLRYMIFFVCVYTFSVDTWECFLKLFSFFALGNFTFFLDLRINFISIFLHCKWHGRNIWVWNVLLWRAALLHSREVPGRSVDFSLAVRELP